MPPVVNVLKEQGITEPFEVQAKSIPDILDGNDVCCRAPTGSGKTKVLTSRVVHIIKEKKAWPNQILCVTFTNKAAREMQNRISIFLNEKISSLPW